VALRWRNGRRRCWATGRRTVGGYVGTAGRSVLVGGDVGGAVGVLVGGDVGRPVGVWSETGRSRTAGAGAGGNGRRRCRATGSEDRSIRRGPARYTGRATDLLLVDAVATGSGTGWWRYVALVWLQSETSSDRPEGLVGDWPVTDRGLTGDWRGLVGGLVGSTAGADGGNGRRRCWGNWSEDRRYVGGPLVGLLVGVLVGVRSVLTWTGRSTGWW
jgi:hypothetical protein